MKNVIGILIAGVLVSLSGCSLAPQTISIQPEITTEITPIAGGREAQVRVLDERNSDNPLLFDSLNPRVIGHRGGRKPDAAPVLVSQPLTESLTQKLQITMRELGFGGSMVQEPVRLQVSIKQWEYSCNVDVLVSQCQIGMKLNVGVFNGNTQFSKPYRISKSRRVAASPIADFNEQWMNETVDELWGYIFKDQELLSAISR